MIGGNTKAIIQLKTAATTNAIGESIQTWENVMELKGWLDLQAGDSKYTTYNTKMQESTHVFIADYVALDASIKAENSRVVVNGEVYDVMLIDDPMGMHKHLEIYLKYTGGQ